MHTADSIPILGYGIRPPGDEEHAILGPAGVHRSCGVFAAKTLSFRQTLMDRTMPGLAASTHLSNWQAVQLPSATADSGSTGGTWTLHPLHFGYAPTSSLKRHV
jgi:hypothetical protein